MAQVVAHQLAADGGEQGEAMYDELVDMMYRHSR
jgi:hypothetical protein